MQRPTVITVFAVLNFTLGAWGVLTAPVGLIAMRIGTSGDPMLGAIYSQPDVRTVVIGTSIMAFALGSLLIGAWDYGC